MLLASPLRRLGPALSRVGWRSLAVQKFPVPEMGDSITEGTLLEIVKNVGDVVAMEEMIASVETDKVTVEVRAPAAGTITALFASVDDTVIVGSDFMEIDVGVGEAAAVAAPAPAAAAPEATGPSLSEMLATPLGRRVHPGGRASLMQFPPRGAAAVAARGHSRDACRRAAAGAQAAARAQAGREEACQKESHDEAEESAEEDGRRLRG